MHFCLCCHNSLLPPLFVCLACCSQCPPPGATTVPTTQQYLCFCYHCLVLPLFVDVAVVSFVGDRVVSFVAVAVAVVVFVGTPVVSPATVRPPLPGAAIPVPAGRAHGGVPIPLPLLVLISLHQPDGLLGTAGRVHVGWPR